MQPQRNEDGTSQGGLRRSLSLPLIVYYGLGNILGAGIYVLIGKVAGYAGALTPWSFLLASLLAGFTAFSYAELSARYPFSAGEVVYLQRGLGIRALSLLVGVLIILTGIVSAATIARGFAGYLEVFVSLPENLAITLLVLCLGALAAWGISQSVWVAAAMTLIEIGGLLLILWSARPSPERLGSALESLITLPDGSALKGIFLGAFLAFYAFIGFEDMVNVAEEVRNPRRNLPLAILLALGLATLLYFAIAVVAVSAVDPARLADSDAPLALIYRQARGSDPHFIAAISLIAVVNGALIQIIMAARVCYGMGRRGWLPGWLARVNRVTHTPLAATVLVTLLVLLMALWLPIETLARSTSFFVLVIFTLVNLSLWRLKHRPVGDYEGFSVYRWVPLLGALATGLFVAVQLFSVLEGGP
ncbi:MAG TPA: amino acid permease [Gammaproteobacteria bacterium]|nr:amino acid permease [Gammaproteobacteria bacterium]